jgi:cytochrome c peroxidase
MRYIFIFIIFYYQFLEAKDIFLPLPVDIEYDKKKVQLGRELFYDKNLSRNKDIACVSCHFMYGADDKIFSNGTLGREGFINAPSVFNLNYHISYFWNARSLNLKEQILDGPLVNKHEMDSDEDTVMKIMNGSQRYQQLFKEAYGEKPTFKNLLDAIVEFQKTLITPNSKFDRFLKTEIRLSKDEEEGFELFKSYGCVSCHNGINLGSNSFQKFGTVIPYKSDGERWLDRYDVTKSKNDLNVFKVPSLRNVEKTAPYFHDGSADTLKKAISEMADHNIGVTLRDEEIYKIEMFLKTLTGEIPKTFMVD